MGWCVGAFKGKSTAKWFQVPFYFIVLAYLFVPNLSPLLCVRTLGALPHGYINLECLILGALSVFVPRAALFALLLMESFADFAYSICYTYQFSLEDLISSSRYIPSLPLGRVLEGLTLLIIGILWCVALTLLRPHPQQRLLTSLTLLGLAAVVTPIDILGGQNPTWHSDLTSSSIRIGRSPLVTLGVREFAWNLAHRKQNLAIDSPMASASSGAVSFLDSRKDSEKVPNVVLIVVESWGLALNHSLSDSVAAPYDDPRIALKYKVSTGAVPFTGLTVPGEARELCNSTTGFGIMHPSAELVKHCLPALLHSRGYQNSAVHGYLGQMFYRNIWYPQLGFDRSWFHHDLEKLGLPNCPGAFPGTCDTSIANWVGSVLTAPNTKPQFVYWVTLNSHLPEPAHPNLPDDNVCSSDPALQSFAALCSWFRLVRAEHLAVENIALLPTARPTVFVLVGDHAPPFSNPQLRARFSQNQVPFVLLTPRDSVSESPSQKHKKGRLP